jgi:S-adenosylmethionine synthetase
MVAAGLADEVLVQVAYAIGVAQPVGLFVNTYGTAKVDKTDSEIAKLVNEVFDLRPAKIVERFGLTNPIFLPTASYGHMGREPYTEKVLVGTNGNQVEKEVEFFAWEKLNYVDKIKAKFGL